MLEIFSNSAQHGIDKSLRFAQTLTKKEFEFLPGDKDVGFIFYLLLLLLPAKQNGILEKSGSK